MVNLLGSALPQFSSNEMKNLKNYKSDFLGINHYTSYFIQDCLITACNYGEGASKGEGYALKLKRKDNVSIGEPTDVGWLHNQPEGFRNIYVELPKTKVSKRTNVHNRKRFRRLGTT